MRCWRSPQRDMTAEMAAARLVEVGEGHYLEEEGKK